MNTTLYLMWRRTDLLNSCFFCYSFKSEFTKKAIVKIIFRHFNIMENTSKKIYIYYDIYYISYSLIFIIFYSGRYGAINNLLYDINIRDLCIGVI